MSTINYAVEITTDETGTDITHGYVGGVFRFITGRPGYDGNAPYPTNEDATDNTYRWFEGWLLIDGTGNPSRRVDITQTGDYGTLSGFSFRIRNDTKFWDFIETYEIWLTNRTVKFYTVIDGVFYQTWTGVISTQPYSETDYEITCVDSFKTVHKEMPPYSVNETSDPSADGTGQGEVVPIVMGNVQYAKLVKFSNLKNFVTVLKNGGTEYKVCNGINYWSYGEGMGTYAYQNEINLVTPGCAITANELAGKYLVVRSGNSSDQEKLIRIRANAATATIASINVANGTGYTTYTNITITRVGLDEQLYGCTEGVTGTFAKKHRHIPKSNTIPNTSTKDTWWFSILDFACTVAGSGGNLGGYSRDARGNILLYTYDKNTGVFHVASDRISAVETASNLLISIRANAINEAGQIEITSPIPFTTAEPQHYDLSYALPTTPFGYELSTTSSWVYRVSAYLYPVAGFDFENISDTYMAPVLVFAKAAGYDTHDLDVRFKFTVYDVYSREISELTTTTPIVYSSWSMPVDDGIANANYMGLIPFDYFAINNSSTATWKNDFKYYGGDAVSEEGAGSSGGNVVMRKDLYKLNDSILDALRLGMAIAIKIEVGVRRRQYNMDKFYLYMSEIGWWGSRSVGTLDEDLYASIIGESTATGGVSSNSVYGAFKLMLEDYDGISTASIDYDNLPTTRADWPVSRQITEKRNSYDYIRELAEQSFVAVYPTRTGKRKLKAWREDETLIATFTEANIIRDSIKKFDKTSVKDLFNTFSLSYHYNAATKKYERSLSIANVDRYIPLPTDPLWKYYVGGVNPESYADAVVLWTICRNSYLKSKAIQKAPDSISKLSWYADQAASGSTPTQSAGVSVDNSPWKFLSNAANWSTRQKDIVQFRVPITTTNLTLEMLDYIKFSDAIFTNNELRPGWITYLELDSRNDQIVIEATLDPIELAFEKLIIERGIFLNEDIITEQVDQDDTLSEPQRLQDIS